MCVGLVVVQLYGDVVPRTVENFVRLCEGSAGVGYAGSNVYRILKDFNIQARAMTPSHSLKMWRGGCRHSGGCRGLAALLDAT